MTTTSAPARSTLARTSSAAPPMATTSWSNPHARATPTAWPSSVPSRYGSSCLGRPRRRDPPAPRTSPATKGSVRADGTLVLRRERGLAALAAEVDRLAVVLERRRAGDGGDRHPADRVDGGRRRSGAGGGADRGARSSRRTATILARIESAISAGVRAPMSRPAGTSMRREELLGDAVAVQLADHAVAALPAGDEADVRQARLEAPAQRDELVAPVAPRRPARGRPAAARGRRRPRAPRRARARRRSARPRRRSACRPPRGRAGPGRRARGRPRSHRPRGRGSGPSRRRRPPRRRPPPRRTGGCAAARPRRSPSPSASRRARCARRTRRPRSPRSSRRRAPGRRRPPPRSSGAARARRSR